VAGPVRISLDSVVYSFNNGDSAETIQQNFPALKLAQIYGAIACYLDTRALIDQYLEEVVRKIEVEISDPGLFKRIRKAKAELASTVEVRQPA